VGLTGVITWAQLKLRPIVSRKIDYEGIQFHGIDEFLDLKRQYQHVEYTVSWWMRSRQELLRAASSCWANTRRHPAS